MKLLFFWLVLLPPFEGASVVFHPDDSEARGRTAKQHIPLELDMSWLYQSPKDVALVRELVAMKAPLNSTLPALVEALLHDSMIFYHSAPLIAVDMERKNPQNTMKSLELMDPSPPKMASMFLGFCMGCQVDVLPAT